MMLIVPEHMVERIYARFRSVLKYGAARWYATRKNVQSARAIVATLASSIAIGVSVG
jgi:hypothetical protein